MPVSPYEPVSVYDIPGVLFSSLLDGELTGETMRSAMLDPSKLTPAERDTVQTRLKQASGDHAVSNALIDIATNPWAWFMFVTSPVGGSALARGAGRMFDVAKEATAFYTKNSSMLAHMGMTNLIQDARGTALPAIVDQMGQGLRVMYRQAVDGFGKEYEALAKRLGVRTLDAEKIYNPAKRAAVQDIEDALFVKQSGMHDAWVEAQAHAVKSETGEWVMQPRTVSHDVKVLVHPDEVLRRVGGQEAVDFSEAVLGALKERIGMLLGSDDMRSRVYRLLQNPVVAGKVGDDAAAGADLVRLLMGDMVSGVQAGKVTEVQFKTMLQDVAMGPVKNKYYMPRNVARDWGDGSYMDAKSNVREASLVKPGGMVINRNGGGMYDPDQLERIARKFGGTESLAEDIEAGRQAMKRQGEQATGIVKFLQTGWNRAMSKYLDDTARTYTMVQSPNAEVIEAQAAKRSMEMKRWHASLPDNYDAPLGSSKGADMRVPIKDIPKGEHPLGGFTLADTLQADYTYLSNDLLRKRVTQILLPNVMGRSSVKASFMLSLMHTGQEMAKAFLETGVGRAMAEGEATKEFVGGMRNWASTPMRIGEEGYAVRSITNLLYNSHLAFNVGATITNMTQPFMLASSWIGAGNVLKAYPRAASSLLGYLKEARIGMTEVEKTDLMRRHFGEIADYGADAHDLLGVTPESLHRMGSVLSRGVERQRGPVGSFIFEGGMKMFESAETLNRLVTGNSVIEAWKSSGRAYMDEAGKLLPEVAADIKDAVKLTQFGGGATSTPWIFQNGAVLSNPLMRQFVGYALRSFTGLAETSRYIGGRKGLASALGPFYDFGRLMGTSAVMYEVGKNLSGVDNSRMLGFAGVTDILPGFQGGRFDKNDGILPMPPALDIPFNIFTGVATGDMDLIRHNVPRLVPGGIAISKLMGGLGKSPLPDPFTMQQQFVGWDQMVQGPDGGRIVPVFKADGTLIDWQNPSTIVLRALGADLGGRTASADVDHFLTQQADQIKDYRSRAIGALLSGDTSKSQAIAAEFKKRTGLVLAITPAQLEAGFKLREQPRFERAMDRLPPDARPLYQSMLQGQAGRAGMAGEQLTGTPTAKGRERPSATGMTQAELVDAKAGLSKPVEGQVEEQGFTPWQGY